MKTNFARIALVATITAMATLTAPTAASAALPTQLTFETTTPIEVDFGESWVVTLRLLSEIEGMGTYVPRSVDGSVDVFLSGISGPYLSGLTAGLDGRIYVSQPDSQPLLAPGNYEVTAIFTPDPANGFAPSQTSTPVQLVVRSLGLDPKVGVSTDADGQQVVTAGLSGSYVEATGMVPAGTWNFAVADAGGTPVYETSVAQQAGSPASLLVEIAAELKKGSEYTLITSFTVVDELSGGVEVTAVDDLAFTTSGGGIGDILGSSVEVPVWGAVASAVALLGLIAFAVVLLVRRARKGAATSQAPDDMVNA